MQQRKLNHFVQQVWVFIFGIVLLLGMPFSLFRLFPKWVLSLLALIGLVITTNVLYPVIAFNLIAVVLSVFAGVLFLYAIYRWSMILNYYIVKNSASELLVIMQPGQKKSSSQYPFMGLSYLLLGAFILFYYYMSAINLSPVPNHFYLTVVLNVLAGLLGLIPHPGAFSVEISEKGIFDSDGYFYLWDRVKSFVWRPGQGRLVLALAQPFPKKTVELSFPFLFCERVSSYLEHYLGNAQNMSK